MRRIRLIIEYNGTNYVGWQTQKNGIAVQQIISDELKKLCGEDIALHGSGRTDSGVHALAQVAHFDTSCRIPGDKFQYALNVGLPADIRIRHSEETDADFHARFDVKRKSYRYAVLNRNHSSAFTPNNALHVYFPLRLDKMKEAAELFVGEHDFLAFKATGTKVENTVRTIYRSEWSADGDMLYYDVTGSGFMYNMVRIMVGVMLDIGLGRMDKSCIESAFESRQRKELGVTAPAKGLYLARVQYADFDTDDFIKPTGGFPPFLRL